MNSVEMNINVENYETCLKILKTTSKETQTNDSRRPHQYTSCPVDCSTRFTKLFCPYKNIFSFFTMFSSNNTDSQEFDPLVDLLVKLRKATISFVKSVRSAACNNSKSTGRIFVKSYTGLFHYIYRKISSVFQIGQKSNRHFI